MSVVKSHGNLTPRETLCVFWLWKIVHSEKDNVDKIADTICYKITYQEYMQ